MPHICRKKHTIRNISLFYHILKLYYWLQRWDVGRSKSSGMARGPTGAAMLKYFLRLLHFLVWLSHRKIPQNFSNNSAISCVLSLRIRLFFTNPISTIYFKLWLWLDFPLAFPLRLWLSHDHKVRWNGRKVQPIYYCNCTPIIWHIAKSIELCLINSNVVKSIFAIICMSCFGVK